MPEITHEELNYLRARARYDQFAKDGLGFWAQAAINSRPEKVNTDRLETEMTPAFPAVVTITNKMKAAGWDAFRNCCYPPEIFRRMCAAGGIQTARTP